MRLCQSSSLELYEGNWQGSLSIYREGVLQRHVHSVLLIERIDSMSWKWQTTYFDHDTVVKDYVMHYQEKNHFILDEGNGINLLFYLQDNNLYSNFSLSDQLLTSHYQVKGPELSSTLTSGMSAGVDSISNLNITKYSIDVIQKAFYRRE